MLISKYKAVKDNNNLNEIKWILKFYVQFQWKLSGKGGMPICPFFLVVWGFRGKVRGGGYNKWHSTSPHNLSILEQP